MAQQISLVHAMHVDTMPAVTGTGICPPGQDVIDDVEAILSTIPMVPQSRGADRPAAYLYFQPAMIHDTASRDRLFEMSRMATGSPVADAFMESLRGPRHTPRITGVSVRYGLGFDSWWVRLNGESALGDGRSSMVRRKLVEPDSMMMMHWRWSPRMSTEAATAASAYRSSMALACFRAGCDLRPLSVYAASLANLVLASYWSPALVAALSLMSIGVESLDEILLWADAAEDAGQPWAIDLAKLARRPDRDVLIRALRTCAQDLACWE